MNNFDFSQILLPLIYLFSFLVVLIGFIWLIYNWRSRNQLSRGLHQNLFLITFPKRKISTSEKTPDYKELISVMEQFYASLSNFREKGLRAFL